MLVVSVTKHEYILWELIRYKDLSRIEVKILEHYTTLFRTSAVLVFANDPAVNILSNLGSVYEEAHKKFDLDRSWELCVFCCAAKRLASTWDGD